MNTPRVFDVGVLGGSPAALVAACLLVRKGYKVVHVEHDGQAGPYQDEGRTLPSAPELLPTPRSSPLIAELLEALSLSTDADRNLTKLPSLQILRPGLRYALHFEQEPRQRELGSILGTKGVAHLEQSLQALFEADQASDALLLGHPHLPPEGLFEKHSFRHAVNGFVQPATDPIAVFRGEGGAEGTEASLGLAIAALERFSTFLDAPVHTGLGAHRPLSRLLRGVCRSSKQLRAGGYGGLLRERFKKLGGVCAGGPEGVIEALGVQSGQVQLITVVDDAKSYQVQQVVSGLDSAALLRLLPLDRRRRRFDATASALRPKQVLFSINLVLAEEGLPEGLGALAFYLAGPEASPEILLLQRFEAERDDERVVQVSTFVSAQHRQQGKQFFEAEQQRLLALLRADLLPFLDDHLHLCSSPYLKGGARGARLNPLPQLETELPLCLGVGLLPPKTPYKNLFLAGRENVPGLGLEGEFLAGLRAAEIVSERSRKHDPLHH